MFRVLVGGAALSRKFTDTKISKEYDGLVLYAKDAMKGLELANQVQNPDELEILWQEKKAKKKEAPPLPAYERPTSFCSRKNTAKKCDRKPLFLSPQDTVARHLIKSLFFFTRRTLHQ